MYTNADTEQDPSAAFSALANPVRIDIIRTLGAANAPLSFSDLHRSTDVKDSGQFNYHLGKLVGSFVHSTEDGYTLSSAGRLIRHVLSEELLSTDPSFDLDRIDGECPFCEAPVKVE